MIGVYSSIGVNKPGEVYSIKLGMSYDSHTVESEKCLNFDKSEEYCHLFFFCYTTTTYIVPHNWLC